MKQPAQPEKEVMELQDIPPALPPKDWPRAEPKARDEPISRSKLPTSIDVVSSSSSGVTARSLISPPLAARIIDRRGNLDDSHPSSREIRGCVSPSSQKFLRPESASTAERSRSPSELQHRRSPKMQDVHGDFSDHLFRIHNKATIDETIFRDELRRKQYESTSEGTKTTSEHGFTTISAAGPFVSQAKLVIVRDLEANEQDEKKWKHQFFPPPRASGLGQFAAIRALSAAVSSAWDILRPAAVRVYRWAGVILHVVILILLLPWRFLIMMRDVSNKGYACIVGSVLTTTIYLIVTLIVKAAVTATPPSLFNNGSLNEIGHTP